MAAWQLSLLVLPQQKMQMFHVRWLEDFTNTTVVESPVKAGIKSLGQQLKTSSNSKAEFEIGKFQFFIILGR